MFPYCGGSKAPDSVILLFGQPCFEATGHIHLNCCLWLRQPIDRAIFFPTTMGIPPPLCFPGGRSWGEGARQENTMIIANTILAIIACKMGQAGCTQADRFNQRSYNQPAYIWFESHGSDSNRLWPALLSEKRKADLQFHIIKATACGGGKQAQFKFVQHLALLASKGDPTIACSQHFNRSLICISSLVKVTHNTMLFLYRVVLRQSVRRPIL